MGGPRQREGAKSASRGTKKGRLGDTLVQFCLQPVCYLKKKLGVGDIFYYGLKDFVPKLSLPFGDTDMSFRCLFKKQ